MERDRQTVPEEDGGVRTEHAGGDDDARAVVSEGGCDPLPGGGECDGNGEDVFAEFDLTSLDPRLRARFEKQDEEETRLTREQRDELAGLLPAECVRFDEPMDRHSSMGVGGPVEAFVVANGMEELKRVLAWASERTVDYLFWGGGSNTLVRDRGIRGLVVKLGGSFDFVEVDHALGDELFVAVGAATSTKELLAWCTEQGLSGLEGLAGVWGTVGGNILTNAGTDEGTIADVVEEITIVNREQRELSLKRQTLRFEYRNLKLPRTAAVVRALFKLARSTPGDVALRIEKILKKREGSQPQGIPSMGCIFRNPGKTPAGVLIEEVGLKGVRVGGARVSAVHANFIVNENNASARDVVVLMNLVRDRVKEETGVVLEPEVGIVGEK